MDAHRVTVGGKQTYGCVNMSDFLEKLEQQLEPNPTSLKNFRRMYAPRGLHKADPKGPLETAVLYDRVQVNHARHMLICTDGGKLISAICPLLRVQGDHPGLSSAT